MIHLLHLQRSDELLKPASQSSNSSAVTLGQPDIQSWLKSYYQELSANDPFLSANASSTPYAAPDGAANNYPSGSVYGPDQVFTQALYNQNGYQFASETGQNASEFTSQLPGVPSLAVQQQFDSDLALENAERLASGQAIDTAAYWSDPGSLSYDGHLYTAQELGYSGPAQSSGAEPIFISDSDKIAGTNTYSVPGYSGTVTGLKPNGWYTLQQLEEAGLKSGQPDAQFHPGSWSLPPAKGPSPAANA